MSERRSPYDAGRPPPRASSLIPDTATQERWLNEAIRFMTELHGRPINLESEAERDAWHARLGLLAHFISWERGESQ